MGFTPRQVDEMSVWQFHACADGCSGKRRNSDVDVDDAQLAELGIEGFSENG